MKKKFIIILFFLGINLRAQISSKVELSDPIDSPLILSGNFGELRSSGFHTGIDIKTNGVEGINVRAIDSGYISRIGISTNGYGKVIYVNHKNNLTSVYAHLSGFGKKLKNIVRKLQYKNKKFELIKFFEKDKIKVSKAEIIGYSGNTGSSSGPHLHFEIRKSDEELPLNPLNFNYKIKDTIRPYIKNLFLYGYTNGILKKTKLYLKKLNDSTYKSNDVKTYDTIGFGVTTYDKKNFTNNIFGNHKYSLYINDSLDFELIFDSFSFPEKSAQKKFIDNEYFTLNKSRIIKLFQNNDNNLSFISSKGNGFIVNKSKDFVVKIKLSDVNKNNTYVVINVSGDEKNYKYDEDIVFPFNKILNPEKNYQLEFNKNKLIIDRNTFEKKSKILFDYKNDTLSVYNPYVNVLKNIKIKFFTQKNRNGQFLSRKNFDGSSNFLTDKIIDKYYSLKTKQLGKFYIDYDTIPPIIKRNKKFDYKKQIQYFISDEKTGIKNYTVKINDRWALFEYEPKFKKIFFKNDTLINNNQINKVFVEIEDLLGNKTTLLDYLKF